ncbi:hypothetical protein AV530_015587 [Patagioenas fasciata monilis]|uniref:Uncharacterized protein n=1 Tax=Patagioenas fasciata monilis TaxID=372326 RepID=A0A1V4KI40_PATFA|nr:hypothetical protein AV530_015587 [Patagioenas fasciata monilis]
MSSRTAACTRVKKRMSHHAGLRTANKEPSEQCCEQTAPHIRHNNTVFQSLARGYWCGSCVCRTGFAVQSLSALICADIFTGFALSS